MNSSTTDANSNTSAMIRFNEPLRGPWRARFEDGDLIQRMIASLRLRLINPLYSPEGLFAVMLITVLGFYILCAISREFFDIGIGMVGRMIEQ